MPPSDERRRQPPEEKTKAENRLMENSLLAVLCVAAVVAGYFIAKFVSQWMLELI